MKLTVLGCNGPYPAAGGACSGYLLETGDTRVLLDCGAGALAALTAVMPPEELDDEADDAPSLAMAIPLELSAKKSNSRVLPLWTSTLVSCR